MKFYNSGGPNPRMVRMFMAEKGIEIPKVEVDLLAGENRREPYLKVNPVGPDAGAGTRRRHGDRRDHGDLRVPRRDQEGHAVADRRHAEPSAATTRMWTRRIDLNIVEPAPTASASPKA